MAKGDTGLRLMQFRRTRLLPRVRGRREMWPRLLRRASRWLEQNEGTPGHALKRGNDSRAGLVTQAARELTMPRAANISASGDGVPRAAGARHCDPPGH